MIINIVINIKKRSGGKDAMLLGDFALDPLENFNLILLTLSSSNGFFIQLQQIIQHKGLLMENVNIFAQFVTHFASTGHTYLYWHF